MQASQRKTDLTNCDREPIHIPGSIQSHGALIACDAECIRIQRHSANSKIFFPQLSAHPGEQSIVDVLGGDLAHDVRNALSSSVEPARPGLIFNRRLATGQHVDVAAHIFKGHAILEFEPCDAADRTSPLDVARALVSRLKRSATEADLIRSASRLIRNLLGYDRVMIYRFAHDGSGEVVSEARRSGLESFMGQHFPASDIPAQARRLYLQNTIRIIADACNHRVPIVPELDASGEPLDLSFAHLRSVSPIHCEYLRNMGVAASMSVSIIVQGELWGLIACHHYAPKPLSMAQRIAAEMFGEFFSLHLEALHNTEKLRAATRARKSLDNLLRDASQAANLHDALVTRIQGFAGLIPADGVALWLDKQWTAIGSTPPASAAPELALFASSMAENRLFATHSLPHRLPSAAPYSAQASGLMAIPLSQRPRDYLFFFRKEVRQTLNWAGDPNKTYETGPNGDRLTPRKSFAIWRQTVEGHSLPWTDSDRDMAEVARMALVEIVLRHSELLQEERDKAEVRQRILNEELNHRVKNILSLIKSLVSQPAEKGRSLRDYVGALQGRIQALSHAHDQIVRGAGGGTLLSLLAAEMSPYRSTAAAIDLDGPAVMLDSRAFSVMALVTHELVTNAAKYGPLSSKGGRLSVAWRMNAGGCEIDWIESTRTPLKPPTRVGFGTTLIERSIPHDLGGESEVRYAPNGLRGRFFLPARHVTLGAEPHATGLPGGGDNPSESPYRDLSILLVEDQMLIALDAETLLIDGGAREVETSNSVTDALDRLQEFRPDLAVLDLNLGAELSLPIAERLEQLSIPFVFATGYGDTPLIPPDMRAVPVVRKPYDADGLAMTIQQALERRVN